jgi:hypothetical protein
MFQAYVSMGHDQFILMPYDVNVDIIPVEFHSGTTEIHFGISNLLIFSNYTHLLTNFQCLVTTHCE